MEVRYISKIKRYYHCYKVGERVPLTLYKYMSIEHGIDCLRDSYLFFQHLTEWSDKYESRFYTADYSAIGVAPDVTPKVYACCFTSNQLDEASLKAYLKNEGPCVRFKINTKALREEFEEYAKQEKGVNVYEGKISYDLSDKHILGLHKRGRAYHKVFFESFGLSSYMSLLLLKRPAFKYENESRFFIDNQSFISKNLKVLVNWPKIVKEILITGLEESDNSNKLLQEFETICHEKGMDKSKIRKYDLYEMPDGPITIEK